MLLTVSKCWPSYLHQVASHAVSEPLNIIAGFAFTPYLYCSSFVVNVLCSTQFVGVQRENKSLQEK